MLLVVQMVCLLTVATQTVRTAVIQKTVFWPSDVFLDAHSDTWPDAAYQNEPEEVTTLGPIRTTTSDLNNFSSNQLITEEKLLEDKLEPLTVTVIELQTNEELTKEDEQAKSENSGTQKQVNTEVDKEPTNLDQSNSVEVAPVGQIKSGVKQQNSAEVADPQQHNIPEAGVSLTTLDIFNSGKIIQDALLIKSAAQQHNDAEISVKQQQNSAEVTGTQQQNSAEVTGTQQQHSAEVTGTQQQNSAEVSGTQQQNSAEVSVAPTTLDPFNSVEITPKPLRKNPPPGAIPESGVKVENNNEKGTASIAGTQAFYPHSATSEPGKKTESTSSAQSDNTGTITTAPGTQPFFPGITNIKEEPAKESNVANPTNIADSVYSETSNDEQEQEGVGSQTAQPTNIGIVNMAHGTQPFFPGIANINEEPQEESSLAESQIEELSISSDASQNTNVKSTQEADGGNSGQQDIPIAIDTPAFTPEVNSDNQEQHIDSIISNPGTINAEDIIKIAGLEPFIPSEPGQVNKIAGLEPILFAPIQQNSAPNSLRDSLSQSGITNVSDDRLLEQAKNYFISIWNLEANRFGAPYLEVTEVWPEIGMVYMPTINQMSSKIQNSNPVKEAAERLKSVWKEINPNTQSLSAGGSNIFGALTDYVSSWITEDQNIEQPILYSNPNPAVSPPFPVNDPILKLDFEADSQESHERIDYEPLPLYRLYWR